MSKHQELQDTDAHTFCRDMKNTIIVYYIKGQVFCFFPSNMRWCWKDVSLNQKSDKMATHEELQDADAQTSYRDGKNTITINCIKWQFFFLSFLQIWSSSEKMSIQRFFLNLTKWPKIRNLQDTDAYILERCEEYHCTKLYQGTGVLFFLSNMRWYWKMSLNLRQWPNIQVFHDTDHQTFCRDVKNTITVNYIKWQVFSSQGLTVIFPHISCALYLVSLDFEQLLDHVQGEKFVKRNLSLYISNKPVTRYKMFMNWFLSFFKSIIFLYNGINMKNLTPKK